MTLPRTIRNLLGVSALALCAFFGTISADDFKSMTLSTGQTSNTIRVHDDQFMLIRNFTQEDLTGIRGYVTVAKPPGGTSANVLVAAALDASTPDVINSVVIAGPADVSFTCGDTTGSCFISYKKDSN